MKKNFFFFSGSVMAIIICSCNNTSNDGGNVADGPKPDSVNNTNTATMSATPLTKDDSTFIMEAAIGGMMEVESGNLAQQNAANARVKNFGSMMITDHSKANDELKNFASSRGMTLPAALPDDLKNHLEEMRKMKGRSFDSHYINMMAEDHQKTIDKFEKQSNSGGDAQLKSWAISTLPVLKKHLDSVQAIKKGMQ
jgi:putative membrane protein